jgi:hypothetical protein
VLSSLKPFIPSGADFAMSKSFFLDLGFQLNWETEGLAELRLGAAAFLLQDLTGVLERYEGARAKEPTDYPWGERELHLIDPAGVCWHFA